MKATHHPKPQHIKILTKRQLPDDIRRHQRPPLIHVRFSRHGSFPLNLRHRDPSLLRHEPFPMLPQGRLAEWPREDFPSLGVHTGIDGVENIDSTGPET
jgi:hypothetical protein